MCGVAEEDVISAPNVESIYDIPLNFEREKLSDRILAKLGLRPRGNDLRAMESVFADRSAAPRKRCASAWSENILIPVISCSPILIFP